jgi:drug/metabolite transporter (DMT)-like permease
MLRKFAAPDQGWRFMPDTTSASPAATQAPASSLDRHLLHRRGVLMVVLAVVVWSSGGAVVRAVEADTWTIVFWRTLAAALSLFLYLAIRERRQTFAVFRTMGLAGVGVGLCFATASTCFIIALAYTTVANVLIIQSLVPFIAAIMGLIFLKEAVPLRRWLAILGAVSGITLMVSNSLDTGAPIGDILAFVIAFSFAGATVILRRHAEVRMTPAACLAAVFGFLFAALFADPWGVSWSDLGWLVFLGAGQLALGLILYTNGARHIPAAEATLITVLEAILGSIWVWLIFGENPGTYAIMGGGIVLVALTIHTGLDWRQARMAPPAA